MTAYSGNSSLPDLYSKNPDTMWCLSLSRSSIVTFEATTAGTKDNAGNVAFWNPGANACVMGGADNVMFGVTPNISAGVELLSKTGRGLLGAIITPLFAVNSGSFVLTVEIDGKAYNYTLPCGTGISAIMLPALRNDNDFQAGQFSYDAVNTTRELAIKRMEAYAAEKTAILFNSTLKVKIQSTVALASTDPQNKCAIQCLMLP